MESKFPTHLAEKVTRGTASPASALSPSPQMVRQGSVGFGLGSHLFPRIFGYFFGFVQFSWFLWGSMVWQLRRGMDLGKKWKKQVGFLVG